MFDRLIGNNEVKAAVRRFIAAGRIPNSLLFAGPEGVGKKQFALELARSIVCREPRDGEACGNCAACHRADVFVIPDADDKDAHEKVVFSEHSDVGLVVPYKRNVLVKAIRDLEREANFRPFEAPARIFIVDDAHKMNDAASNALLKTLEEPPETSHIFLISSKADSLLATIRSRSQMLRFAPVAPDEIEHLLLASHDFSQEDARLIALSAYGNVSWATSVKIEEFRQKRENALEIVRAAVVDRDIVKLLRMSEMVNDAKNKEGFEEFLDILASLIRQVWSLRMARRASNSDEQLNELAEAADPTTLAAWLQDIEELRENLAVNINRRLATDAMLVQATAN